MPAIALCVLWALATAARPAPPVSATSPGGSEPAQNEELTLLFHGALQLGQALNGVYRATEARLSQAGQNLGLYDQALGLLGQKVSKGREAAQELRASLAEMQREEDFLQLQAEATARVLSEVTQAQWALWDSVRQLQGQLNDARLGPEFEALKAQAHKQSHIVWVLAGHVQRQKREMASQQHRLRQIQERLHTAALPA
ncbi:angiopoietin-like protein 8 isoform X2 [Tupaia chinensis]|uniref:angiopoietin-like protein 8 isoform X2 n=1 Tax=Tupaia chinensis TaxID=246437 RepID=UPI0003C91BD6|nr:angiopoietin-like protein 8 isoform X2 [Tupaia chinensis]